MCMWPTTRPTISFIKIWAMASSKKSASAAVRRLDDRGVSNGSMDRGVRLRRQTCNPTCGSATTKTSRLRLQERWRDELSPRYFSSTGLSALGTLFVAFGTTAGDYDHDGDEDIMVTNGHVLRHPPGNTVAQLPLVLKNSGKGRLMREDFGHDSYFSTMARSRRRGKWIWTRTAIWIWP